MLQIGIEMVFRFLSGAHDDRICLDEHFFAANFDMKAFSVDPAIGGPGNVPDATGFKLGAHNPSGCQSKGFSGA